MANVFSSSLLKPLRLRLAHKSNILLITTQQWFFFFAEIPPHDNVAGTCKSVEQIDTKLFSESKGIKKSIDIIGSTVNVPL